MSIAGVSAVSLLEHIPPQQLDSSSTQAASIASTTAAASISATTANAANDANSLSALTADLIALLKSLATGDVGAAKTDLAKVQTDLEAQDAATSGLANSSTSPLDELIANISSSFTSGSTAGVLQALASYLVATGLGTGRLVNTTV